MFNCIEIIKMFVDLSRGNEYKYLYLVWQRKCLFINLFKNLAGFLLSINGLMHTGTKASPLQKLVLMIFDLIIYSLDV